MNYVIQLRMNYVIQLRMNYVIQLLLGLLYILIVVHNNQTMMSAEINVLTNAEKYPPITEENRYIQNNFRSLDQEYTFNDGEQWMITKPFGTRYNMWLVGSHWEEYSKDAALSQRCWGRNCRQAFLSMAISKHNLDVVKKTLDVVKRQQYHSMVVYITLWCSCLIYIIHVKQLNPN